MHWIVDLLDGILDKGEDGEFDELEKSFFILIGNVLMTLAMYLLYMVSIIPILKVIFAFMMGLNCLPLTKNIYRFNKLKNKKYN